MAKDPLAALKSGGGLLKKVVGAAILIALLVIVVKHPSDAASWVSSATETAAGAIDGIVAFIRGLAN